MRTTVSLCSTLPSPKPTDLLFLFVVITIIHFSTSHHLSAVVTRVFSGSLPGWRSLWRFSGRGRTSSSSSRLALYYAPSTSHRRRFCPSFVVAVPVTVINDVKTIYCERRTRPRSRGWLRDSVYIYTYKMYNACMCACVYGSGDWQAMVITSLSIMFVCMRSALARVCVQWLNWSDLVNKTPSSRFSRRFLDASEHSHSAHSYTCTKTDPAPMVYLCKVYCTK